MPRGASRTPVSPYLRDKPKMVRPPLKPPRIYAALVDGALRARGGALVCADRMSALRKAGVRSAQKKNAQCGRREAASAESQRPTDVEM